MCADATDCLLLKQTCYYDIDAALLVKNGRATLGTVLHGIVKQLDFLCSLASLAMAVAQKVRIRLEFLYFTCICVLSVVHKLAEAFQLTQFLNSIGQVNSFKFLVCSVMFCNLDTTVVTGKKCHHQSLLHLGST